MTGVLIAGDAALTVDLNSVGGVLFGRQRSPAHRYTTWNWPAAQRSVGLLADLEPRVLLWPSGDQAGSPSRI